MRLWTFLREEKQSRTTRYLTSSLTVIIDLVLLPKDFLKLKALTLMNYSLQLSAIKLCNCSLLLLHLRIWISKALISKQPTYMAIWMRKSTQSSQKVSDYLGKKTKSGDFTKHCTALSKSMLILGFKKCKSNAGIYYYYDKKTKALVITIVYVNDVCFMGTKGSLLLNELKQKFMTRQECRDLGETTEFLGMHISHNCKN